VVLITSFEDDRSANGLVEERSSINDRGAGRKDPGAPCRRPDSANSGRRAARFECLFSGDEVYRQLGRLMFYRCTTPANQEFGPHTERSEHKCESNSILSDSEALREANDRSDDFLYISIDDGKIIRLVPAD